MGLYHTLGEDLKTSMKTGDTFKRDTVRLMQSALKNESLEKRKPVEELTDEEAQTVLKRMLKQRKDSIEQYQSGGREDLAEQEANEAKLLESYLPEEMSEADLEIMVGEALTEAGLTQKAQFGQAMGVAMKTVAGKASGDRVKEVVGKLLT
jgi:uncharacterized protein YqeY